MNPFDFVNSINTAKTDLISENPEAEKEYVPFLTNKALSYSQDSIFHSQVMNENSHIDKKMQYDYFRTALSAKRRFGKWVKPEKNDLIDAIKSIYHYNDLKAEQALKCLSDDQKSQILKIYKEYQTGEPSDLDK